MASLPSNSPQRTRARHSKAWVPDQHGAWFMVTVPALTGFAIAPSTTGVAVLLTWWFGYFAFFAMSVWMRSRFQSRHRRPVIVYCALTLTMALVTLISDWTLLRWLPWYAPLIAIAMWETFRRRPRSLASGVSTVVAAGLMLPTVASAAMAPHTIAGPSAYLPAPRVWIITAVYLLFFLGTIPYVKTLIRERGNPVWLTGSIVYHVLLLLLSIIATVMIADSTLVSWLVIPLAAVLLLRAIAMPLIARRRQRPWPPRVVGGIDAVLTLVVVCVAW